MAKIETVQPIQTEVIIDKSEQIDVTDKNEEIGMNEATTAKEEKTNQGADASMQKLVRIIAQIDTVSGLIRIIETKLINIVLHKRAV